MAVAAAGGAVWGTLPAGNGVSSAIGFTRDKGGSLLRYAAVVIVAALSSALAFATAADGFESAAYVGGGRAQPGGFDTRLADPALEPTSDQRGAERGLSDADIVWDPALGTPRSVSNAPGYLTGPTPGGAVEIARAWMADNLVLLGLTADDVSKLELAFDHALPGTGLRVLGFQQVLGGLETAFGGRLNVAVASDGRVLSFTGDPTPATQAPQPSTLSAAEAVERTAAALAPARPYSAQHIGDRAGYRTFTRGPFARRPLARPVAFPTGSGARSAYDIVFAEDVDKVWRVVIDARTGQTLLRRPLTFNAVAGEGAVFENYPGALAGGRQVVRSFAGDSVASPAGWIGPAGPQGFTTAGNNVDSFADWNLDGLPDQRPFSPDASFTDRFTDAWRLSDCTPPAFAKDADPAATNVFYHVNRLHDRFYRLGFTESAGNFQQDNFGRGGVAGDGILALNQAGANVGLRNNAIFVDSPDGVPGIVGFFLFEPIANEFLVPCVDSDFDAAVVAHEYAHGLSFRYVAGGEALNSFQSGAMGEGWSDFYALDDLDARGLQTDGVLGPYSAGNSERGIRNHGYHENPLNYGDIGYDVFGPEVHADGEIWAATLLDLRRALIDRYGRNDGIVRARRLVTDAMPLTAPDPSMIDARNGIIIADVARYGAVNFGLIWHVFARRGMGAAAASASGDEIDPTPGFEHPFPGLNGIVGGRVVDSSTAAAVPGARVSVGPYEARVSPLRVTGGSGSFAAAMVGGRYDFTVQAPGYGATTFEDVAIRRGRLKRRTFAIKRNLASRENRARVVAASSEDVAHPASNLIDDTAATGWLTSSSDTVSEARIVIELGRRRTVSEVRVSAYPALVDPTLLSLPFTSVRDWTLEISRDGRTWRPAAGGTFRSDPPFPVAPELRQDRASFEPRDARFLRFTAASSQGALPQLSASEVEVFGPG